MEKDEEIVANFNKDVEAETIEEYNEAPTEAPKTRRKKSKLQLTDAEREARRERMLKLREKLNMISTAKAEKEKKKEEKPAVKKPAVKKTPMQTPPPVHADEMEEEMPRKKTKNTPVKKQNVKKKISIKYYSDPTKEELEEDELFINKFNNSEVEENVKKEELKLKHNEEEILKQQEEKKKQDLYNRRMKLLFG